MTPSQEMQALRDRIIELEELLGLSTEVPRLFWPRGCPGGRKRVWRLLCFLAKRPFVTSEAALIALQDGNPDTRPGTKIIQVYVCHLRRFLKPHDIVIRTVWGEGWRFDVENRAKARALIEQYRAADRAEAA